MIKTGMQVTLSLEGLKSNKNLLYIKVTKDLKRFKLDSHPLAKARGKDN